MFIVMSIFKDSVPNEIIATSNNLLKTQKCFLHEVSILIPWLRSANQEYIDNILSEGFFQHDDGCICLIDTSNAIDLDK